MGTKQSIIKAELIPQINQESLRLALGRIEDARAIVPEWKAKAEAWVVDTPEQFKAAGEWRRMVRSQRKTPKMELAPYLEKVKQAEDYLKDRLEEAENDFDGIDDIITGKMDAQATRERLAAEAEQRRINEEKRLREQAEAAERRRQAQAQADAERKQREKEIAEAQKAGELKKREAEKLRKEAEAKAQRDKEAAIEEEAEAKANFQPVEVKPNLPTIAGSRRHRTFSAEFINFPALLEAWRQAKNNGSTDRAAYLSKFICGDEQALGREARDVQDSRKLMEMIPGIKAEDKDKT